MTPNTNTKPTIKSTQYCRSNDDPDACPEIPFSKDRRCMETKKLTCFTRQWVGLYMVWFLMLECIFERTVRS